MSDEWEKARVIRASEIGEYVYCRRQWWLKRRHHVQTAHVEQLEEGTKFHEEIAELAKQSIDRRKIAYVMAAAAFTVLLLAMLLLIG